MRNKFQTRRYRGFTLIELMVVVAVVGVLLAIILPAYTGNAERARRAKAMGALMAASLAMERYFTEQSPSTYTGATLGATGVFPNKVPLEDGTTTYYNLTVNIPVAGDTFTLTATPTGSQAGETCGTLTLNNLGVKTASGGSLDDCWDR